MLDMPRQKELLDHVEHDQRRHAVIGKTLPRFGEGEIGEAARVAEKHAIVGSCGHRPPKIYGPRARLRRLPFLRCAFAVLALGAAGLLRGAAGRPAPAHSRATPDSRAAGFAPRLVVLPPPLTPN